MAKQYSRSEWARLQSRLPEEDRVPYEESPDVPVQRGVDVLQFPRTALAVIEAKGQSAEASAAIAEAALRQGDMAAAAAKAAEAAAAKGPSADSNAEIKKIVDDAMARINQAGADLETKQKAERAAAEAKARAEAEAALKALNAGADGAGAAGAGAAGAGAAGDGAGAANVKVTPTAADTGIADLLAQMQAQFAAQQAAAAATAAAQEEARRKAEAEAKRAAGQSAYSLLFEQFNQYGLGALVEPLKQFIIDGLSPAEFTLRLRETDAYKKRFAANQQRIAKGLRALSEAEYIGLEDQYQDIMRRYGMPESYYKRGDMGRQEGFEKFIGLDVSPIELEDRIQTAYDRVINANPEVGIALRNFYPGITNGDVLAYALDPEKALGDIKRKITAAEIGGAAVQAGLTTNESDAEYLARYGITKEQAQAGYRTISGFLPRAQQLSSIYQKQVEGGPYTQASAEREVFGVPGAAEEERKRQRITSLEQAAFAGQSGLTGGALGRERAGSI